MNDQFKIRKTAVRIATATILISSVLWGCKGEELETTPPGKVTNITYRPTLGGAVLHFTAPNDNDLLYVKASYTNSLGEEVFKVASHYTDSIEIDGFNDETVKTVRIYAIDHNNNQSEATEIQVTPQKSYIHVVEETLSMKADLGGVRVSWKNPAAKTVFVYVYYTDSAKTQERILSSASDSASLIIRGLDAKDYSFSVMVEDFSGNKTAKVAKGTYKPMLEQKINKSTWTVVQNLSVDGDKWEGTLASFFDDVVDTKESSADNSYFIISRDDNGGMLNWPLNVVIDLNKTVVINRFVIWQRAFWYTSAEQNGVSENYYYYQSENMKSFEIFVSNDKVTWTTLGTFDIGNPVNDEGKIPSEKIQEAIDGHEFNLTDLSIPFRYLKVSLLSNFGSEANVYGSEITLYGLDNQ